MFYINVREGMPEYGVKLDYWCLFVYLSSCLFVCLPLCLFACLLSVHAYDFRCFRTYFHHLSHTIYNFFSFFYNITFLFAGDLFFFNLLNLLLCTWNSFRVRVRVPTLTIDSSDLSENGSTDIISSTHTSLNWENWITRTREFPLNDVLLQKYSSTYSTQHCIPASIRE